jgi:hypothetical protein
MTDPKENVSPRCSHCGQPWSSKHSRECDRIGGGCQGCVSVVLITIVVWGIMGAAVYIIVF